MSDPPDDGDLEGLDDIAALFGDEIPVWGTLKRVWRFCERKFSAKYRAQIARLYKKEKILIATIDQQNENIRTLRNYIQSLEMQMNDLEDQLVQAKKQKHKQS